MLRIENGELVFENQSVVSCIKFRYKIKLDFILFIEINLKLRVLEENIKFFEIEVFYNRLIYLIYK